MNNPRFFPVTYYNGYSALIKLKDIVRVENTGTAYFVICKKDFSRQITKESYHNLYNTLFTMEENDSPFGHR